MLILPFLGRGKTFIRLSYNGGAHWGKKTKWVLGFSNTSLKRAINHSLENYRFNVGNVTLKQAIVITTGNDPATFLGNLFSYFYG